MPYLERGIINQVQIVEQKFQFSIFNASLFFDHIYFYEHMDLQVAANTIV
jgi:hypothetical protein